MTNIKRITFLAISTAWLLFSILLPFSATTALAQANEETADATVTTLHYFDDPLCSVCADQKTFMASLKSERDDIEIIKYPISDTATFKEFAADIRIDDYRIMAPSTFIRDELLQFNEFGEREQEILVNTIDSVDTTDADAYSFTVPVLGMTISDESLPLGGLAIVLGSLDGFNVCSLGALILILSIVLTLNSRKKIFTYGGIFILTTVVVYGSLVFVWGQLINALVGSLELLRLIVGLAALTGAAWFFREFWRFYRYGPTCESSNSKIAQKTSKRLLETFKNAEGKKMLPLIGAIISFGVVITLVELPCSIGIPVAFTSILVDRGVSLAAYTGYILLYLFFYMLIELVIFAGAVFTKQIWFSGSKAITWTTFAGALILLLLGLYYLAGI